MTKTVEIQTGDQSDVERFVEKARIAAAQVTEIGSVQEAIDYTLNLCGSRGACRLKVAGCDEHLSPGAEELCETKQEKIIAAPDLDPDAFTLLKEQSEANGFTCISGDMRSQLAGVDIGFSFADIGIAETGTIVMNCPGEDLRLASDLVHSFLYIKNPSF